MQQASERFFQALTAREIVYHFPDGYLFVIPVSDLDPSMDFGPGRILDTSDIDGRIHYFPQGNA